MEGIRWFCGWLLAGCATRCIRFLVPLPPLPLWHVPGKPPSSIRVPPPPYPCQPPPLCPALPLPSAIPTLHSAHPSSESGSVSFGCKQLTGEVRLQFWHNTQCEGNSLWMRTLPSDECIFGLPVALHFAQCPVTNADPCQYKKCQVPTPLSGRPKQAPLSPAPRPQRPVCI